MAFLFSRVRNGKKHYFIAWFDLSKGKSNAGRCDVSCNKYGAVNSEQRKILLKQFQDKEDKIAFEIENNLFKPKQEDFDIAELVNKYLEEMQARVQLRENTQGKAGISKSYYWWLNTSVKHFQQYLLERNITKASQIKMNILSEYRKMLELKQESLSVYSINNYLRYTKRFLNDFKFADPPVFHNLEKLLSVLKFFPVNKLMPFHFETDDLREILTKAHEFDSELCKITRESKNAGKTFKGKMPAKNVPITPMILLVMLTGMRKSDALALKWSNVNLETGLIRYQAIKNGKICIVPLVGDPSGDISPEFVKILRKWRKERPNDEYVLPHPLSEKPTEIKAPINRFKKRLSESTAANFNWQNLRKNFESYAVSFGIPPAITAFWVGHSPAVAEKHYMSYAIGKLNAKNIAAAMNISDLIEYIT